MALAIDFIGGAAGTQGVTVYSQRSAEAGVPPSSQVLSQLAQPAAKMAHARIGLAGAGPLGAALAANTAISSLDLSDNDLCPEVRGAVGLISAVCTCCAMHMCMHGLEL